ncbi:flagellar filament capping protein FliD [Thermodesulfovibrio thiophilus]|uniref:flagellar filament capping protein FliD n=1 Tax=Thermodesulfovibrio thiophilus TaxID=340095 RepID=UPI0017A7F4F0|nr:flagellar filament capping protein FliD [Thermodesulfovibrio thiophilus]HHW21216.1 flagellar filament capping protein FliD [Thermodesulfovibrio thiophilus]
MADLYVSGLTGTFDSGTMIDKLLQIKQQPITALTQKKALIQAKVSSLTNLYGALNDMNKFISNLNITDIFSTKKASSSDTSVLEATATKDSPNLTMNLTVNKLAQTEMRASSSGLNSLSDKFSSSGTLTLTYWTDSSNYLTYNIDYSEGQTIQDLANNINSAQNNIKASVYYTGTDYRLMLTEADAGNSTKETDTGISLYVIEATGLPAELGSLDTLLQNAQNASITIGNSTTAVTSPTNTFTGLITGLDITVKKTGSATLSINDDYSQINSTLSNFANSYNSVISLINSMTAKGAQFQGDSTVTTIKTGFTRLLDPLIKAGLINYSDTDGTISVNSDVLDSLKSSDPDKLKDIMTTVKSTFSTALSGWTNAITTYQNTENSQINSIDQKIQNMQEDLVKYEERLRKEYAQLESFISQMNEISSRLNDFMVTLSQMTTGGQNK